MDFAVRHTPTPTFSGRSVSLQASTFAFMGIRIGTGLGPISVSARIGGGGGGGGDGFGWLLFGVGVLVFGPLIIWILERDWKNIFAWWIFLHALPSLALFGCLFVLFKEINKRLIGQQVFFSLIGPIVYLVCLHKIPLAINGWGKKFGCERCGGYSYVYEEVRKVFYTAPAYNWLLALCGAIVLPTGLFLISSRNSNQILARQIAASKAEEITRQRERDKRRAEQAPANAVLLAERDKRRADEAAKLADKKALQQSKQKLRKDKTDALEDALARLAEVVDKVFSLPSVSEGVHIEGSNKLPESLDKALRDAFSDVTNLLSKYRVVLSENQIAHHQSGLYRLRQELEDRFGFKDL